nr:unnamed protein product [Digitaria exilis]
MRSTPAAPCNHSASSSSAAATVASPGGCNICTSPPASSVVTMFSATTSLSASTGTALGDLGFLVGGWPSPPPPASASPHGGGRGGTSLSVADTESSSVTSSLCTRAGKNVRRSAAPPTGARACSFRALFLAATREPWIEANSSRSFSSETPSSELSHDPSALATAPSPALTSFSRSSESRRAARAAWSSV